MSRLIKLLLTVLSGVMLSLAWLGFPGWVLFAAFLPLLVLDDFYVENTPRRGYISFWGWSFLTFLIWNSLTTWWIIHATPVGAFLAIVANSFLMSFFFLVAHFIRRNSRKNIGYLALVCLWISFEYAHFHWDIEWPWLMLGNGFADNVKMVQWYGTTGALGGSVWIWTVNILLFIILKQLVRKALPRQFIINLSVLALLILAPVIISLVQYYTYKEVSNPRKVLIIQPNIDPYSETHDEGAMNDKLNKFIRLTESHMQEDVSYIVGPETVFEQNWNEEKLPNYPAIQVLKGLTHQGINTSLVIGASTYRFYNGKQKPTRTARKTRDGEYYDGYNTALFIDSSEILQTYHKSILVPGVEKMPFRKYLKFLDDFVINMGGTTGSLGIQPEPTNFVAQNGDKIAPAICYESVFGGYLTEFTRKGAQVIFIITNDGWWKNTPGFKQHFSFARLRAIEMRRSIVRSANTGISGIINQRGDVVIKSQWWVDDTLTGEVNFNNKMTFYAKYGDYPGRISALISILFFMNILTGKIIKGKKNRINSDCVKPR
jgi:apolipoprotein N-acyltransferase